MSPSSMDKVGKFDGTGYQMWAYKMRISSPQKVCGAIDSIVLYYAVRKHLSLPLQKTFKDQSRIYLHVKNMDNGFCSPFEASRALVSDVIIVI
ncbi:uncharacterized protein PHALS_12081 [Plasmopara halstedii]|uniref:Uncharacterized protein n=1 Tax=Plasmopara halstedii TaxID=4781 RepID=A0A0P1AK52_PLAHL|nr:uncharacterized protein PHALS_12081 [Plasmopara halstedii]CEG41752.1 hypothetical protein PHALS_12081 [Plasmopara halstedii]|eukprot:XP_024578121.1 hypothetical protein PHALS_12081 [Plasmopara halstedii]